MRLPIFIVVALTLLPCVAFADPVQAQAPDAMFTVNNTWMMV